MANMKLRYSRCWFSRTVQNLWGFFELSTVSSVYAEADLGNNKSPPEQYVQLVRDPDKYYRQQPQYGTDLLNSTRARLVQIRIRPVFSLFPAGVMPLLDQSGARGDYRLFTIIVPSGASVANSTGPSLCATSKTVQRREVGRCGWRWLGAQKSCRMAIANEEQVQRQSASEY